MYLLDTMILDWLATGSVRLGTQARTIIEAADREALHVSTISFWEIGLLLRRGHLRLDPSMTLLEFRQVVLDRGITEVPLSGPIVLVADTLEQFHKDPGDRFIAATAIVLGATLITSDRKILAWAGALARLDAEA